VFIKRVELTKHFMFTSVFGNQGMQALLDVGLLTVSSGQRFLLHFNSTVDSGDLSASLPGRFTPEERSGTHWIGSWVGPRAGLDVWRRENLPLPGIEPRFLGSPARNLANIPTALVHSHIQSNHNPQLLLFISNL
jgi:hypothetical protein